MYQYYFRCPFYRYANYVVKPGDTLYFISQKYNTTVETIQKANNLTSDLIYVGQSLIIPAPGEEILPSSIFRIGSRGPEVAKIQQALSTLGLDVAQDGIYGPMTSNIIMNMQNKFPEELTVDGVYGPKTKVVLERLLSTGYRFVQNPDNRAVLVNKKNSLSPYYAPKNLTVPNVPFAYPEYRPQKQMQPEAARALEALFAKAKQDGIDLNAISGYRSYDYQSELFKRNISANPYANQFSARPGESEHQTGLAMDVSSPFVNNALSQSFGDTKEGKWLAKNAPDFGFILRFPNGKENITGYQYEPWHIRYVGKDIAKQIANQNITLEEYLG